jgi:hypothetical protein
LLEATVNAGRTTPDQRLGTLIRLLASEQDGEALAAARAIVRTLKSTGADIHVLAERVETANGGKLTDADMRKLYDAGFAAGKRAGESKQHGGSDGFHNVDGTPDWHEIARFCQQSNGRLRPNEQTFINDMAARSVWREPTEKQEKWLRSIFYRLGGKI